MGFDSERFLKRGREETIEPGATIYKRGDPCSDGDIFFVIDGSVTIESPATDPLEGGPRLVPAGHVFGVVEPYAGRRHRDASAKARSKVRLYRWNRRAFDDAMGIYQELATLTIRSLSSRLRELNRLSASRGGSAAP